MLKATHLAMASAALVLGACASGPSSYNEPVYTAQPSRTYVRDVAPSESGYVAAIDTVRGGGHTSGGGAVVGAIVGGVLGHQVGSGRGNDAATVAGAVGGAVVGNEVERRRNDDELYRIVVRLRDGREASFTQESLDGLRVGDRVRVVDNRLYRD